MLITNWLHVASARVNFNDLPQLYNKMDFLLLHSIEFIATREESPLSVFHN